MQQMMFLHFRDEDQVVVRHTLDASRPMGYPIVEVDDGVGPGVRIFPTRPWLERFTRASLAYLAAHPEEDGPVDRCDIYPAEAVVDGDELLASMAESFDVRRAAWEG